MKKWLARQLRYLANFLDPAKNTYNPAGLKVREGTPLEFIPTTVLANTIRERNDCCILFWGKTSWIKDGGGRFTIKGDSMWQMTRGQFEPLIEQIAFDIATFWDSRDE